MVGSGPKIRVKIDASGMLSAVIKRQYSSVLPLLSLFASFSQNLGDGNINSEIMI